MRHGRFQVRTAIVLCCLGLAFRVVRRQRTDLGDVEVRASASTAPASDGPSSAAASGAAQAGDGCFPHDVASAISAGSPQPPNTDASAQRRRAGLDRARAVLRFAPGLLVAALGFLLPYAFLRTDDVPDGAPSGMALAFEGIQAGDREDVEVATFVDARPTAIGCPESAQVTVGFLVTHMTPQARKVLANAAEQFAFLVTDAGAANLRFATPQQTVRPSAGFLGSQPAFMYRNGQKAAHPP